MDFVVDNTNYHCTQIGCTLLGRADHDERGVVRGFEELYIVDNPVQYEGLNDPLLCVLEAEGCNLYAKREGGSEPDYFKSPEDTACIWVDPPTSGVLGTEVVEEEGWYKPKSSGGWEVCDTYKTFIDKKLNISLTRPRGRCVTKAFRRSGSHPN